MRTNLARHHDPSSLQKFLESNPLVLLIGVGVAVATVVAGVMAYLTTEKMETLKIAQKTEITELKNNERAELFEVTLPLKSKIEDLNFRLSSIERRVPGAGPSYLDVSTITIGPETRKTLGERYISYDNDGFFLAIPAGPNWTFLLTNELDFLKSMYSVMDLLLKVAPQFQVVSQAPIFLWKGSSELKIWTKMLGENVDFTFHPTISVQHYDQNLLKDRLKLAQDIENKRDDRSRKDELLQIGPKLDEQKEAVSDIDRTKTAATDNKNDNIDKKSTEKILSETKRKQEVLEVLDKISATDLATFEFLDIGVQMSIQNRTWPLHNKILSAQKKGNVFYMQVQVVFRDVEAAVNEGPRSKQQNILVDEEIFFFGRGSDGYLVKVILPPVPDRAENFTWSKSWLTGLQIPID